MAFSLKSFSQTLRYTATPSAVQLQANLRQIATQDKQAEKKRNLYLAIAILSGLLTFGSFVWMAEVGGVFWLPAGLLLVTIVASVLASRWGRLNVSDLRYSLPPNLANLLSRDMAKDAPFDVRIDFSKPTVAQKKVGKEPYLRRPGWTQTLFEDPWLHLSGRFLDNTAFVLTINEHTVVRAGWKRGRSGKRKYKTKTKPKGLEAQLLLQFSRKKYGAMSLLNADLPQAVSLPPGVVLKKIKASDHQLVIRAKVPPHTLDGDGLYQLFTQMLLSAYQGLNLSKELSKELSKASA